MADHSSVQRRLEGVRQFETARRRVFFQEIVGHLRGKSTRLLSFDRVRQRLRLSEESFKGLQYIPLDQIVGSVGRYDDFTRSFLPRRSETEDRWSNIYAEAIGNAGLPPIELYKISELYFVRDGNHRVSVARRLGAKTIEAYVTELPSMIWLDPTMTSSDIDAAACYAEVVAEAGLNHRRMQGCPFNLTEPSRYCDLVGHVRLHQAMLEQKMGQEVSIEEAALDWYDQVYNPIASAIYDHNILELFPGRTKTDVFLWLIEYFSEMEDVCGIELESCAADSVLVEALEARGLPVPAALMP